MKKQSLITILLTILMSVTGAKAFAHDIEAANSDGKTIYYVWANEAKTVLAVSFRGSSVNAYKNEYTGNVVIPESVAYNGNTYPVASIGSLAFCNCSGLTSINIPNSVTYIGRNAFEGCSGLTSINIPNSVTYIDCYAFESCRGLTSITIPKSLNLIDEDAFLGCVKLNSVYISDLSAWCNINFQGGEGYTSPFRYASHLFLNGKEIIDLVIPDDISSIRNSAFSGCTCLTSITIPNSVTFIGDAAFSGCSGLTSVISEIENPFDINNNAFNVIPTNVPLIVPKGTKAAYQGEKGWSSFNIIIEKITEKKRAIHVATAGTLQNLISEDEKYQIEELTLTGELNGTDFNLIREMAGNIKYRKSGDEIGSISTNGKLKSLDISEVEIKDGGNAYYYVFDRTESENIGISTSHNKITYGLFASTNIESIVLPKNVTYIDNGAFAYTNLISLTIPDKVTAIGSLYSPRWEEYYGSFEGCAKLTTIDIPNNVNNISVNSFRGCSALTSIRVESGNKKYDSRNNCNAIIETSTNKLIAGCKNTIIPKSVTSIYDDAFWGCSGLTSIIIPNSVTYIGYGAFYECRNLTSVISDIENPLIQIGSYTFSYVPSNAWLIVPKGTKTNYQTAEGWNFFHNIGENIDGDVNLDGKVDKNDVKALEAYIMGMAPEVLNEYMANVNKDDKINAADIVKLIDMRNTGDLGTESQFFFDNIDGNQMISSLYCTLTNNRDENIQLTRCELYNNGIMISYKNFSGSSSTVAASDSKSCSFDNLAKLNSSTGFTVSWHYTVNGESFVYHCPLTD